jgi:mevalonyl-CoA ligase
VARAVVVGLRDAHYGEVVAAFLEGRQKKTASTTSDITARPTTSDVREWVRATLGKHKAPSHVFWLGSDDGVPSSVPLTGSGKVKKFEMARLGEDLVRKRVRVARL